MFIPFLGAVVGMGEMHHNVYNEAKVALAGPIVGGVGAFAVHMLGLGLDSKLLLAAAYTAYFLNLFNLLPLSPLDGVRAAAALHPGLWLFGILWMVGLMFVFLSPVLLLMAVIGGMDSWNRW